MEQKKIIVQKDPKEPISYPEMNLVGRIFKSEGYKGNLDMGWTYGLHLRNPVKRTQDIGSGSRAFLVADETLSKFNFDYSEEDGSYMKSISIAIENGLKTITCLYNPIDKSSGPGNDKQLGNDKREEMEPEIICQSIPIDVKPLVDIIKTVTKISTERHRFMDIYLDKEYLTDLKRSKSKYATK